MLTRMVCVECGTPFDGVQVNWPTCPDCEKAKRDPLRIFIEQRRVLRQFVAKQARVAA